VPSPKLLDREWLRRQEHDGETITRTAVRETGKVAKRGLPGAEERNQLRASVAIGRRAIWETFVLLEAGLLSPDDESRKNLLDGFPFGDQKIGVAEIPSPGELHEILITGGRFAGALIPLDGSEENHPPATVAVWRIGNEYPVIVIPDNEGFVVVGESGRLARKLTSRALEDASEEKPEDYRVKLASDWIVTGALDREKIREVSLGNKTNLRLERRWLLPRPNFMSEKPKAWREAPRYAESVEEAKKVVTGSLQTRSLPPGDWPEKTEVLFSFTSKAARPLLAAALLGKPDRLVLISSNDEVAKSSAKTLRQLTLELLPDTEIKVEEDFPSDDLAKSQDRFRKIIEKHSTTRQNLFHLTNGNLLMRSAVILDLHAFPQLSVIYKDFDTPVATEFTRIDCKGEDEYETGIIIGERESRPELNWDVFLEFDKGPDEENAATLLNKLKTFPES